MNRQGIEALHPDRMKGGKARAGSVFRVDFRDGNDLHPFASLIDGQQPQGAASGLVDAPIAKLDFLERMRFQRLVDPLFDFTGHILLLVIHPFTTEPGDHTPINAGAVAIRLR